MRPILFAVSLSLALAIPALSQAAERARRGPALTTPSQATEHLVTRGGRIRTGALLVPTGGVKDNEPELAVMTLGSLNAATFADKAARGQRFFGPIMAGKQDRTREWVLKRGRTRGGTGYVAFLSGTDPRHPMTQADLAETMTNQNGAELDEDTAQGLLDDHGFEGSRTPFGQRAHILVVPTVPREHIGKDYVGTLGRGDYELMLELMDEADGLGRELKLQSPKVFQNTATVTSVGQTHIHLVGALTNPALLKDLEAPAGGRPGPLLTMDGKKVVPMGPDGLPARGRR